MLGEQSVGCHLSYLIILFSFLSILQIGLFKAPKLLDYRLQCHAKFNNPFCVPQSPSCPELTQRLASCVAWKSTARGRVTFWHGMAAGLKSFSLQETCLQPPPIKIIK